MQALIDRARKFPQQVAATADRYAALTHGQQPAALFVTCSDSRVIPALFTGAQPGELFELRTAGNVVPPFHPESTCAVAATLQYAVEVLDVSDVVVCGHTHCGAVRALIESTPLDGLPLVQRWLAAARRPGNPPRGRRLTASAKLEHEVQEHLRIQLDHLSTYPFVRQRLHTGRLRLHGWVYAIDTGAVTTYQAETGRFVAL